MCLQFSVVTPLGLTQLEGDDEGSPLMQSCGTRVVGRESLLGHRIGLGRRKKVDSATYGPNGRCREPFSLFTQHCSLILTLCSLYNKGACKGLLNTDTIKTCHYSFFLQSFQNRQHILTLCYVQSASFLSFTIITQIYFLTKHQQVLNKRV